MANLEVLTQPFPAAAIKKRTIGGGFSASYVDGITVIRRLNEATGNEWNFTVDRYWVEGNLSYALVTLELPGHGSRQHIGVQSINERSGEDAIAKGAITDALKKAATLFGVAAELYGPDHEAITQQGASQSASPAESPRAPGSPSLDRSTVISGATQAHPRVTHGHSDPASPKQFGMIKGTARDKGMDDEELAAECWRLYEKTVGDLTKREASAFIDHLKGDDAAYPAGGIVHGGDADPGYSLGSADPASEAATGMNDAAEKHWIGRLATMSTDLGVTGVVADAARRFGEDRLTARFTQAVASRRREIEERGRG